MGQIDCRCRQGVADQQTEIVVPKSNPRKIKNRVRSILQPKDIVSQFKLKKCSQPNLLSCINSKQQQYCTVQLESQLSGVQIQIRGSVVTIGTENCHITMPQKSQKDEFRLQMKYDKQNLKIRDAGIGLGTFISKQKIQISKAQLINLEDSYYNFELKNAEIEWGFWNLQGQQKTGKIKYNMSRSSRIKDFIIKFDQNSQQPQVFHKNNANFWVFCNQYTLLNQEDVLRLGQTLYFVNKVQNYIESSRLIHKY